MTYRMKRLAGSAVSHFSRLTRSGKDVCRRILPFSKKNKEAVREDEFLDGKQAAAPTAEVPKDVEPQQEAGEPAVKKRVQGGKKRQWTLDDFQVVPDAGTQQVP